MTNAQRVFDIAMGIMDEVNESSGATDTPDTKEYKNRTLLILNALRGELYPYSDTFKDAEKGKRPIAAVIADFESDIDLDDYICQSVLPYGLVAHLLLNEDPSTAGFCQQRYEELKSRLATGLPAEFEDIVDVYGGIEYGEFSRW